VVYEDTETETDVVYEDTETETDVVYEDTETETDVVDEYSDDGYYYSDKAWETDVVYSDEDYYSNIWMGEWPATDDSTDPAIKVTETETDSVDEDTEAETDVVYGDEGYQDDAQYITYVEENQAYLAKPLPPLELRDTINLDALTMIPLSDIDIFHHCCIVGLSLSDITIEPYSGQLDIVEVGDIELSTLGLPAAESWLTLV
jgi:hypothetical protein